MSCIPCFSKDEEEEATDHQPEATKREIPAQVYASKGDVPSSSNAQTFTFRELAMATKNFRQECLLGEGGFGRVFKGKLQSTGQVVAVKQLDRNGMQGNKEFLVELLVLSLLQHPNLVSLIGYCADGDQRLLVYEYMPMGSLEDHLFGGDSNKKVMDWYMRMKIALGTAKGLEYLHNKANPPTIYRDLKPSNVLLDESYEPKLSDFGLAKLAAGGGNMHPTSRVMGTYGYSAPEYSSSGELTLKSDVYIFGVVLLELITGRKVIDTTRPNEEQNLVSWAQPIFREPKRFPEMADPRLNKEFPMTSLNQAVGIAAMCLQEDASVRPLITDVVAALSFLSVPQPNDIIPNCPPPEQKMHYENNDGVNHNHDGVSSCQEENVDEQPNEKSAPTSERPSFDDSSSYSNDNDSDDITDDECSKSEVGNGNHSSRSLSVKQTDSSNHRVTFKEPDNLNSKQNGMKHEEESSSDIRQQSCSSSSESMSESEDEKGYSRHQKSSI